MKRLLKTTFKRFYLSEQGSAMPLIGFGIFVMVGSAGIAIDMGRVQIAQSRMSSALDAAGLAAGSNANTVNLNQEVTKYFNANYPPNYMGSQVTSLSVTGNPDLSRLTLNSQGVVPMTLMKVFGIESMPIQANSEITRATSGLEVVLVMDVTGSMGESAGGGQTKIQAARAAATTLVNLLYGSRETVPDLWVGMVPFSQAVNIGNTRANWTQPDTHLWPPASPWAGCVQARELANEDTTDTPPSAPVGGGPDLHFPKYYWGCHTSRNAWHGTNATSYNNCQTTPSASLRFRSGLGVSLGPNRDCPQAVLPLTSSKTTVLNSISTLQPRGNTLINIGMVWGWRMLSPRWRGLWGGEMNTNDLPLDYDAPLMNKAVVLMTDGDNVITNTGRGAYGYLEEGRLGTTNQSTAETRLDQRMTQVCTSMKNNGIIVYTVALGTTISTATRNLLRNCATRPEYYFFSPTGTDLQNSFRMIGDSLANLRVSR
ncbi:MAG: pilus assembly protein TadG-related protein [Rickettsiales bacterium]|jgi:Flp pilus assembly protein TadG|nr:pilus assembly protein TadG-related protein [Rickettsiales bacterium]